MSQWNEVAVLTEAIDDGEDDRFAADARKSFDEVQPQISPNRCGYWKRQQQPGRVEMFRLVALAGSTGTDVILDHRAQAR